MTVDLNETLTHHATPLTVDDASTIARAVYGLQAEATPLSGERDQNFLLQLEDGSTYVLKATHPAETPGVTDFQTRAQLHIKQVAPSLPVARLVPALNGEVVHWHVTAASERRAIRLFTRLPGTLMCNVARTPCLRRALGIALARLDLALRDFTHPQAEHVLLWDLQHTHRLRGLLPFIGDDAKRKLAARYMDRFEVDVLPRLPSLRRQVIHNDFNAHNVMVHPHQHDRVTGIFDFGDMVEAPLVQDLAVACAYQLSEAGNPLTTAAQCVAAYHGISPLTAGEIELLPALIAARLLVTVAITGWRATRYPENAAYILRNNALSWNGLQNLATLDESRAKDTFHSACENRSIAKDNSP
ncbi:phosphotransferase [Burkholderia sp. MSMB1589WGS]|uniref:phosphotransferase n=1 Tax=Burkholderia sp. MSMB1589WGS TaxID=1636425 RepID=UPI0009ED521E|nr:phosphotransferase [Burkholderia sp. MSMB1589WGS]